MEKEAARGEPLIRWLKRLAERGAKSGRSPNLLPGNMATRALTNLEAKILNRKSGFLKALTPELKHTASPGIVKDLTGMAKGVRHELKAAPAKAQKLMNIKGLNLLNSINK